MKQSTFSAVMANNLLTVLQGYSKTIRLLLVMFLALTVSANVWGAEVTFNISNYASANNWTNGTAYSSANINTHLTATKGGTGDNGKYYTSNSSWRFYEANDGSITISTNSGTLQSITFTYSKGNNGVLKYNNNGINSGTACSVSGTSATFTVSHSSGTKNGNVQITSITITYTPAASCNPITPSLSYTPSSLSVGGTANPTLTGNSGNGSVTYSSSNTSVATVNASTGIVTAKAAGATTITATIAANNGYCEGTATANVTVTADPYTVTLVPGSGSVTNTELEEPNAGAGVTLPTPTLDCGDWEFAGWKTTSAVTTETTTEPTLIPAGAYSPTSDITLYAVYQRTETIQGGGSGNYELVTSAPSDWSGTYLIVDGSSNNCFNGSLTTLDAGGNYATITISDNTITSTTTTDSYAVTISKSTTNGKYYIKTASGYYIGSDATDSSKSNELDASTSTKYDNSISISSNNVTIQGPDHILKFFYQTGQPWRFRYYKSTTTSNVRLPQLYKKSSGTTSTTYYHSTPDCGSTEPSQLATPTGLNVTNITSTSATLSWGEVANASSYTVFITDLDDEEITLTDIEEASVDVTGLSPETLYLWDVVAIGDGANYTNSEHSSQEDPNAEFTTLNACEQLGAATGLTVVTDFVHTDGETYVKFSWTPADNTKNYAASQKLCFGKVGEAGTCVDDLAKNLTWTGDLKSKLDPGEYWWSIQALGDGVNYCDGDVVNGTNFTIEAPKTLTNYRTFCDVVCDAYSFHTGTGEKETWLKEAIKCFVEAEGGYEHEWQIKDYIIPEDDKFFVGNYGYFYNDNLGIGNHNDEKSRSVVSDWGNMYLAPAMDENDAPGTPRLGHAKGAKGTLRIFDDSNWDNLYVGFIPDGYKLKFGTTEYAFAMHNEGAREYRSEGLVHYEANTFANSVSVGVVDEAGSYVATNHTQEMRHIFLKVSTDWASNNAKFSIYDIGASAFKSGFMKLVPGETDIYEGWVDKDCEKIIFVRHNSTAAEPSFDDGNKWNQTADLDIQASQNMFTITGGWDDHTNTGWAQGLYTKYGQFAMHDNSKSKNWYVHFVPHYVLKYDKNADDAIGTMNIRTVAVDADANDKKVVVANCGFTRPGYRFIKWRKGTTSTYYVPNGSNTIELNADITLHAQWEKEYTVTYDANSGTTSCVDKNAYIKGQTVTVCDEVPTKTGHTFLDWSDGTNTYSAGATFTMPAKDVTLTAQWQIDQYTVTLNPNYPNGKTGTFTYDAGELVDGNLVLTYDYNTTSKTIADLYTSLTLDGYEFGGWYNAKGVNPGEVSGSKCTTTGTITGNKTYYAKWSKLYSITLSENGTTTELDAQTSTSYTLPTELSAGSCLDDTKELVGWSTVAIPNPGDKPTSNFYELGETVTLTADQTTFYAVFATVGEGGVGTTEIVKTETFSNQTSHASESNWKQSLTWDATESNIGVEWSTYYGKILANDDYVEIRTYSDEEMGYVWSSQKIKGLKSIQFNGWHVTESDAADMVVSYSKNNDNDWVEIGTHTAGSTSSSQSAVFTIPDAGVNDEYYISIDLSNATCPSSSNKKYRIDNISLTILEGSGTTISYSDYTTTCVKLPDPVLSFETEPANPIVFTDAVCGGNSSKQSVTVVGENLRDVVNVSVTGPYKIARTASTALKDFTTSLTLDKTAAGAIHSNYKTVYIISTPPAQSTEATAGILTFTTTKGNTLTVNLSTPTVTCAQYTLTLVDRGVSTEQPTKYYAGETIDEAPADPEGVCTDPIHYVFDGWAAATVAEGSTTYTKVTFPYIVEGNTKFYAVYRYVEDGGADSGDYVKVTENLDDYSGDYLIVYEPGSVAFDGGRNNVDDDLDATSNTIEVTINGNTIASNATTDAAKFTIAKVDGGYSIQSASGYYIGRSATSNGLNTNETYSANYDLNTITDCKTIKGKGGNILKYNKASDQKRFRYYQSGQEDIALYRKAASYLYTTSPVCGPHLVITEGKDIYVTGGNAGGTRDLVIAQQKVSYKATRLQTSNGLVDGTAPDVKVATNGITVGGVVTSDVKVTIDQTKEQQTDGTYTITGTITVQYQPSANNKQEDIQVQLAVDYNAEARDNFTVHARSLPSEFVIVAKSGDKWYALNGDMNTNAANPANGQVTLDNDANPTKATYAPCNTIYTFDGVPNTGDRTYVRFQGTDGAWLWASSGTNVGIQNNVLKTTPEGNNNAYNWKLYTEDNITYRFGNANSSRQLTLNGEKFGMYASGVQDIRILPYEAKCLYNYAPSNLKVSVLKGTYVTLTWDAVIGATKYQYSTNGTTWTDAGTEPTVTINGLEGNTEYTYYIRAYHEDAGVTNECIDYAEITFTTADCDDVPTDITYSADLNSITVSWTAEAPTATITYNTKEDGTGGGGTINNATSPYEISGGLDKNTTYYIQILADGTCASPIIPVKTEDVEVDVVEWKPQGIIVDINTDETIGVTLENEVSYGSGLGSLAEDLFFSKYFEGSGSLKMIAIYNGTGKDVDLSEYRIDRGSNGDATNISKTYDLSQLGIIKQGQEIIFYSWPLTTEYSYSCSQSFLDSKVQESGLDANPRWILCDAKTHNGIEFEAMDFSGNDPLLLYKSSELIDVFGVSTAQESPASTQICSGRSDEAWSADGVTNMDYGKTTEDFPNGEIPHGVNVDDETITAYTARVIMFRKNTVVSGKNAVTKNTTTFATFAEEWEARQVCMSGDDGDLTCAAYQELGTFDYSDYYTKYEPMGEGTTFDENARNADGTVTIPITDLYKYACSNIRVKLTNSNSEVLSDREYKVPIMITTTQGTDGQAFLALQENLATVEVDSEGKPTGNKTNLTLEQVREICKTCDVVVRDNAILTKVTDGTTNDHPQVHDVIVYEGASIVIPDGEDHNYTINSLALRRKGDEVASAQVQGTGKFVLPADAPVTLSMRIDANNWHWFTLPYDCDIAKVTWSDGTPAKYNTDWFLMYYDGESRAASTNPYDNHWKVYSGTTIEAGKGYILGITGNLAHPNYTFELHFPMAQGVLTDEQQDKTVALNAWGVKSGNTPNNLGWNLVGNPYLNYYKTADEYSLAGLPLIHYIDTDPVTGEWNYENSGSVPYVVTPINGGWYEYKQDLASAVQMMPFTAYFVQVGDPATHENGQALDASFEASNRGKKSILRRAPSEVDDLEEPAIVAISLTNAKGESDKTTLIIDDRFTNEYEMNGDFFKWFGDYYRRYTKPVLYSMGADQGKRAFNALSEQLAAQPVALGMFAAQAGDYTFSLTRKRCDLSRVEEVWLYDATTATYTNLMQQDYTFTTAKTEGEGRFYLSVKMRQNAPTDITDIYGGNIVASAKDGQIIVGGLTDNTQLWIYDATGKLLHTEHTTNFQHVYEAPVAGTYFVRTQGAGQAQTIKVLVE